MRAERIASAGGISRAEGRVTEAPSEAAPGDSMDSTRATIAGVAPPAWGLVAGALVAAVEASEAAVSIGVAEVSEAVAVVVEEEAGEGKRRSGRKKIAGTPI